MGPTVKKYNSGHFKKGHTINNGKIPWNIGTKSSDATRLKQSSAKLGRTWDDIYGAERAVIMRQNIQKRMLGNKYNKLGYGQGGGYTGKYKKWYFRSLIELSFILRAEEIGLEFYNAEKMFAIPLPNGRIYRPDFYAPNFITRGCIIEVKPTKRCHDDEVNYKSNAAAKFCAENNMEYTIGFDLPPPSNATLKSLYENGLIIFADKTKIKLERKIYARL